MSREKKTFQQHLQDILCRHTDAKICWIAYSGGLDSHVLLHLLAGLKDQIKQQLTAVHINHQLSQHAAAWQRHCQHICADYQIKLLTFTVDITTENHQGIEATARKKRYAIFSDLLSTHDLLLTAHHLNDQIETVLLQLLRGCGPDGLVGIPHCREFFTGHLLRPLLDYSKADLYQYAQQESLHWVEDESNQSNKYDRNFLRNEIIPKLLQRWPGALKTIRRSSEHQRQAKYLIDEIAQRDLEQIGSADMSKIDLAQLGDLSSHRKKHVLRAWIKANKLAIASAGLLARIDKELIHSRHDRTSYIRWQGIEIRTYRGYLHIVATPSPHDNSQINTWKLQQSLQLGSGQLSALSKHGSGIKKSLLPDDTVEVRFRQGGEKIKPVGRAHTKKLKKLLQESNIPPWIRNRIPLIFHNGELIAVADLWIAGQYFATESEPSWKINWQPLDHHTEINTLARDKYGRDNKC